MELRSLVIAAGMLSGAGSSLLAAASPLAALSSAGATISTAAPAPATDPVFGWKQGWTEVPQWGGRLAFVDLRGDLKVRLRSDPEGTWIVVARQVRSFQLLDWSLVVLSEDGSLLDIEGALNAPPQAVAENVCAYQKTLTRLGILKCDGTLLVKEIPSLPPRPVAAGVEAFHLLEDRAAFRGTDGSLWVQDGGVVGDFHKIAEAVASFQIEQGWLAYLEAGAAPGASGSPGRLMMVEGSLLLGTPVAPREVARGVSDFEMEVGVDSSVSFEKTLRLAVLTNEGVLRLGVGRTLPIELKEFDRGAICSLAWAGDVSPTAMPAA